MRRYIIFGCILFTFLKKTTATSPPKFDFERLFNQSIYTYELQIINDSSKVDENYPTKNLSLLRVKCSFYLIDTAFVAAKINKETAMPVSIKCTFILSDNQSTNAIINPRTCSYRVTDITYLCYNAIKQEGFFYIDIPIKNELRRFLRTKTLKYIQGNFRYHWQLTHRCILSVPYESYN